MKKVKSLLLVCILCFSLCACAREEAEVHTMPANNTRPVSSVEYFSEYRMPKPIGLSFLGYSRENRAYAYSLGSDASKAAEKFVDYVFSMDAYGIYAKQTDDFSFTMYVDGKAIATVGVVTDAGAYILMIVF